MADTSNLLLFVPGCKTPDQMKEVSADVQLVHTEVSCHFVILKISFFPTALLL